MLPRQYNWLRTSSFFCHDNWFGSNHYGIYLYFWRLSIFVKQLSNLSMFCGLLEPTRHSIRRKMRYRQKCIWRGRICLVERNRLSGWSGCTIDNGYGIKKSRVDEPPCIDPLFSFISRHGFRERGCFSRHSFRFSHHVSPFFSFLLLVDLFDS